MRFISLPGVVLVGGLLLSACSDVEVAPVTRLEASRNSAVIIDAELDLPQSAQLQYRWTMVSRPPISEAVLKRPGSSHPEFFADHNGEYRLELVLESGVNRTRMPDVLVTVTNDSPTVVVGPDRFITTPASIDLLGMGSDGNDDTLTYEWSFQSRPPGSAASLSDPSAAETTLTTDLAGEYVLSLVVDDGEELSQAATVTVRATDEFVEVPGRNSLSTTLFSDALDTLISAAGDKLRLTRPATGVESQLDLPAPAIGYSLSRDGLHALVSHEQGLAVVDLVTETLGNSLAITQPPQNLVMDSLSLAFYGGISSIDLVTGARESVAQSVASGSLYLDRAPGALYAGGIRNEIEKWDTTTRPFSRIATWTADDSWDNRIRAQSEDGSRLLTQRGAVLGATDLVLVGQLETDATFLQSIADSSEVGLVATLHGNGGSEIELHDAATLTRLTTVEIPEAYTRDGRRLDGARQIFFSPDGLTLYVLYDTGFDRIVYRANVAAWAR